MKLFQNLRFWNSVKGPAFVLNMYGLPQSQWNPTGSAIWSTKCLGLALTYFWPVFVEPVTWEQRIHQDYTRLGCFCKQLVQHRRILLLNVKKSPNFGVRKNHTRFRGRKSLASVQHKWPPRTFSGRFGPWSWNQCSMPCLPAVWRISRLGLMEFG